MRTFIVTTTRLTHRTPVAHIHTLLRPQFQVIGFPSNEFGGQEPGTDAQINDFVCSRFKATFPLTTKVEVNGANAHPLWAFMKKEKKELFMEAIKWNFAKFLIGKDGAVIERFAPTTSPESIASYIEKAL
jgi:glutathione peroxidase